MNFLTNFKSKNGLFCVLLLAFILSLASGSSAVMAAHDAKVTITPDIVNCDQLGFNFTANVENNGTPDSIFEVRIYEGTYGVSEFYCGQAPSGWTLSDYAGGDPYLPNYGYCEYKTAWDGPDVIGPGEDIDFTFDAVMWSEACYSEFLISTLDNKRPTGEHKYHWPQVQIDCVDPVIEKQITSGTYTGVCPPEIQEPGEECWMTYGTIHVTAYDNTSNCDLGVDYCDWDYTVDGSPNASGTEENGGSIGFDIDFDEDSVHVLTITCYDIAGNEVTDVETFKVDDTPPETTKNYGEPHFPEPIIEDQYPHWITNSTPVALDAVDGGDICAIGVEETWYRNIYYGPGELNQYCEDYANCMEWEGGEGEWTLYEDEPFYKEEQSCHIIEYYSVDELGNTEDVKWQCVFVDNSEPVGEKEIGEPKIPLYGERDPEEYSAIYDLVPYMEDFPTGTVEETWDGEKAMWDIEIDGDYTHTEFQLVIANSDDGETQFLVAWGSDNGYAGPFYKPVGPGGCWSGAEWQELPDGFVVTGSPGDENFHIEIPMGYLNDGDYYWAVHAGARNSGNTKFAKYPEDWNKWQCTGRYEGSLIEDWWVQDHVTEIGLTCTDQEPHPVDHEEVCFRVSFDVEPWLTEFYCNMYQGTMQGPEEDDWCCIDSPFTIIFQEDSLHDLEYYCRDALGNDNEIDLEYFRVDSLPPIINKTLEGPQYGQCPPEEPGDECWIKDWDCGEDGTTIHIEAYDNDTYGCAADDLTCSWWYLLDGEPMQGETDLGTSFDIKFYEDTEHELHVECCDALGNCEEDVETFYLDSQPPETAKWYNGSLHCGDPCEAPEWITSQTFVNLDAYDHPANTSCAVGVYKTFWKNILLESEEDWDYCYSQEICDQWNPAEPMDPMNPEGDWNEYLQPFTKPEESCHIIEYYSTDELGNFEDIKWQCVFVDNTPPERNKTVGEPKINCSEEPEGPLGNGGNPCDYLTQGEGQCAYVDSASLPPYAYDTLVAQGADSQFLDEGCGYLLILSSGDPLEQSSTISTDMNNPGCGLNPDGNQTYDCVILENFVPGTDSVVLAVSSEWPEYLGSPFTDWMQIFTSNVSVDISINDWNGTAEIIPYGPDDSGTKTLAIVGSQSSVNLRAADSGDYIYDTALIVAPLACFEEINETLLCGNGELDPGEECDDGNQENGDGCSSLCLLEEGGEEPMECWWVRDHVTEVTLDCEDQGDHPVYNEEACFQITWDEDPYGNITDEYCLMYQGTMEEGWCCLPAPRTIIFEEDSEHELEFYCRDVLGNMEPDTDLELFKVDSVAPVTNKTYHGAYYLNEQTGAEYLDTNSWITLDAEDGGPICAVGVEETYWQNIVYEEEEDWYYCQSPENCEEWDTEELDPEGWEVYEGEIHKDEESCHVFAFYSEDRLGNTEDVQWQCFFVDKTAPYIYKTYGQPIFPDQEVHPAWINDDTPVYVEVRDDVQPHPSGVSEVKYRYGLVADEYCEYNESGPYCEDAEIETQWTDGSESFNFTIGEESCHLIEIYAEDNVEKNRTHKQCVYVDTSAPEPNKTVGEPKDEWDGSDAYYYNISDLCWNDPENPDLECWKVTLLTPIELECTDLDQPHPVPEKEVCFKVEWDLDDVTEMYCSQYVEGGTYDKYGDGYCCMESGDFYFHEETEHKLEYYCLDVLGNKGETVDVEMFKVTGTTFNITINKKWNLISVPFVMLDNSIDEAFENIGEDINAVWTYDAFEDEWYVYTPGPAPDTLDEMDPGWGYWVHSDKDTVLQIGGSLFMPGQTPPDKYVKHGWNLIGYYGNEDHWENEIMEYDGPDREGEYAYCALFSLGEDYLDKGWSSLLTYWEPWNPNQWDEYDYFDQLDPGAGYWIFATEDGIYAYTTNCPLDWFEK